MYLEYQEIDVENRLSQIHSLHSGHCTLLRYQYRTTCINHRCRNKRALTPLHPHNYHLWWLFSALNLLDEKWLTHCFSLIHLENLVDQIGTDHPFDTITELIEEVLGIDFSSFSHRWRFERLNNPSKQGSQKLPDNFILNGGHFHRQRTPYEKSIKSSNKLRTAYCNAALSENQKTFGQDLIGSYHCP